MTDLEIDALAVSEADRVMKPDGAFGFWINALWPEQLDLAYHDKKKLFISLLKHLLDQGNVVLLIPDGVELITRSQGGNEFVWDLNVNEMIDFIEDHWPDDVHDEKDERLLNFWYDSFSCPGIGWIDPVDGAVIAS